MSRVIREDHEETSREANALLLAPGQPFAPGFAFVLAAVKVFVIVEFVRKFVVFEPAHHVFR